MFHSNQIFYNQINSKFLPKLGQKKKKGQRKVSEENMKPSFTHWYIFVLFQMLQVYTFKMGPTMEKLGE